MCCLNAPLSLILLWIWIWQDSYDYSIDDNKWTIRHIITLPFVCIAFPILLILDIVMFPFHLINIGIRRCRGIEPSYHYWYEYMLCDTINIEEQQYRANYQYMDV